MRKKPHVNLGAVVAWGALAFATLAVAMAHAGFPPTTLKGQSGSKVTTFNFQVPANQATQVSGTTSLIETGNGNLLANPGLEGGVGSLTASGGTLVLETTNKRSGSNSASWDSSAAGQTLSFAAKTFPAGAETAYIWTKCASGTCTHLLEAFDGVTVVASVAITSNTSVFVRNPINFTLATPTSITIRLKSVASNEPVVYADDAYGGEAINLTAPVLTDWASYTPTTAGLGTPSSVVFYYRRVGDTVEIQGRLTCGTTTATQVQLGLPSSLTTSANVSVNSVVGRGVSDYNGGSATNDYVILASASVAYVNISLTQSAGTNPLSPVNGSAVLASGDSFSFFARVPVTGWTSYGAVNALDYVPVSSGAADRLVRARAAGDGSCTLTSSAGFSSPTNTAAGKCTFTLTGFTVAPTCVTTAETNRICVIDGAPTTTQVKTQCFTTGFVDTDTAHGILCMGAR